MRSEVIRHNGINFRRYPDSKNWADRAYFTPPIYARKRGVRRLHEELWIAANGSIPDGHDIHHADGDSLNNDIANLICLTVADHQALHVDDRSGHYRAPTSAAIAAAARWHRSEQGREWHSQHLKQRWEGHEARPVECERCRTVFQTRKMGSAARFCSNACKSAWRRESGADAERRACAVCGTEFATNRYSKARTCSRVCAQRSRRDRASPS